MSPDETQEVPVEVGGVSFTVTVTPSPSGIRGKVWYHDEKIAGMRLFHSDDVDQLLEQVRRDAAVLRAVERLSTTKDQGVPA